MHGTSVKIVCLYFCLNYPECSAHAPYCIVICGLSGGTVFFSLCPKRLDFRGKKVIEHTMGVLIISPTFFFLTFLIVRRIPFTLNVGRSSCEEPAILVKF